MWRAPSLRGGLREVSLRLFGLWITIHSTIGHRMSGLRVFYESEVRNES
jgi:hypothetical protein